GDQRGGGDERTPKSGHSFTSAWDNRETTIGKLKVRSCDSRRCHCVSRHAAPKIVAQKTHKSRLQGSVKRVNLNSASTN
ncbi:MAG: hypothetical protein J0H75_05280, partial [Rhizobiales bacterium]|nr:hypothetical protein [Hyphomicrobiales bacterium]